MKKHFFESGIPVYQDLDKVLSSASSYENKISEINKYYNKEEIASFPKYLFLRKDYIERKLNYQKDTFLLLRPVTLPIICLCAALIAETGTSVQMLNMSIKELFLVLGVLIPCISIFLEDKSMSVKSLVKDRKRDGYDDTQINKAVLEYEQKVIDRILQIDK